MNLQANPSLISRYSLPLLFLLVAIGLSVFNFLSAAKVLESKQEFDRQSLLELFAEYDFDNNGSPEVADLSFEFVLVR